MKNYQISLEIYNKNEAMKEKINKLIKDIEKCENKSKKMKKVSKIKKYISETEIKEKCEINILNQKTECIILQNIFIQDKNKIEEEIFKMEYNTLNDVLNETKKTLEKLIKLKQEISNLDI